MQKDLHVLFPTYLSLPLVHRFNTYIQANKHKHLLVTKLVTFKTTEHAMQANKEVRAKSTEYIKHGQSMDWLKLASSLS